MSSETTMAAEQCRLREWAVQIRDCQSRPAGMSVVEWCACHGITKASVTIQNQHYSKMKSGWPEIAFLIAS